MKKNMKKGIATLGLAATLLAGSVNLPGQQANAGVIIGILPVTGLIGGVIGLTMASVGFFGAIKAGSDLKPWTAVLFVLSESPKQDEVEVALSNRYPELDAVLVNELSHLIIQKSTQVVAGEHGLKEVVFNENEIASVLGVLAETNPDLEAQVRSDLTQSSLKSMN